MRRLQSGSFHGAAPYHACACVGAVPSHGLCGELPAMKKPRPKQSRTKTKIKQGRVLVVTSGKGGVGKTTSSAALGAALAHGGEKVVIIDFDVGLRNLDLVMGAERRVVFDLINVLKDEARLAQALIRDKRLDTLSLLPASQSQDKDSLTEEGVARIIAKLRAQFDWVICDSPAGTEKGATLAMRYADVAVVVVNPEVSSIRDADRIIGMLDAKTAKAEQGQRIDKHLLLTRYDPIRARRGEIMSVEAVREILSIPLLGIIPESAEVLRSSNVGAPVTLGRPDSSPAQAYLEAARRLKGEVAEIIISGERPRLFHRLFTRRAA
jgi:septum site-determining protein MinD